MQVPAMPMQQWAIANQMMLHAGLAAPTLIVAAVVVGVVTVVVAVVVVVLLWFCLWLFLLCVIIVKR